MSLKRFDEITRFIIKALIPNSYSGLVLLLPIDIQCLPILYQFKNFIISYLNQQLKPNIMALAYINLSAKQYFNFMCRTDFERRIFHDTYKEFQKKSKTYAVDGYLHTFSQMLLANEKANHLNQKLHYSVINTIDSLGNLMPMLSDIKGKPVLFDWAELNIHESDLLNKACHVVSITYTSPKLVLHEIVDDSLILSYDIKGQFNSTFILKMTDDLVINYHQANQVAYI